MLFRKKGKMIDLRHLQKGSVVKLPSQDAPQSTDGYVNLTQTKQVENKEEPNVLGLLDSTTESNSPSFSTQEQGYNKREVDAKITELDNKIYRLEQRVELLERKAGVDTPQNQNTNLIGW